MYQHIKFRQKIGPFFMKLAFSRNSCFKYDVMAVIFKTEWNFKMAAVAAILDDLMIRTALLVYEKHVYTRSILLWKDQDSMLVGWGPCRRWLDVPLE